MKKGTDYNIKKLEKGPLQRFKNQNLILKKYGETGLRIYRAITGKRTVGELKKDLDIKKDLFDEIINYLQEAEMVELSPVGKEKPKKEEEEVEIPEEEAEEAPEEVEEEAPKEEEEIEIEEEEPEEEIVPEEEEIKPIGIEFEEEEEKPKKKVKEEPEEIEQVEEEEEEIEPIAEETHEEEPVEEEEVPDEEPEEEVEFGDIEEEVPKDEEEEEGLTPIEKIIKNKYGDIGLRVYNLIDGQKTAEEIMNETGLSESKLIEILDFMDEQGIIKLDYPKSKEKEVAPTVEEKRKEETAFGPMVEAEEETGVITIPSPVEIPVKSPVDIVKSVQFKTKLLLKFKDKGSKLFESIDGKKDVIDLSLKLDIPLYQLYDMLHFMMESDMVMMKPITRNEVKKKYGDDGYTVYKRYGREGLMLYELIGKELTIKQMADKVTKDYSKVIDMFLFIHEVLGIELPIDRGVLARQLGI